MKKTTQIDMGPTGTMFLAPASTAPLSLPSAIGPEAGRLLQRMFRDPRVLEPEERASIVAQLRNAVELEPHVAEVRVLYGMALCVDLQVNEALEQLRESTQQAPECFIARRPVSCMPHSERPPMPRISPLWRRKDTSCISPGTDTLSTVSTTSSETAWP